MYVYVTDLISKSSDLNLIENMWELLARKVYVGDCQFDSVADLQVTIMKAWNGMSLSYLRTFSRSMSAKIVSLIDHDSSAIYTMPSNKIKIWHARLLCACNFTSPMFPPGRCNVFLCCFVSEKVLFIIAILQMALHFTETVRGDAARDHRAAR